MPILENTEHFIYCMWWMSQLAFFEKLKLFCGNCLFPVFINRVAVFSKQGQVNCARGQNKKLKSVLFLPTVVNQMHLETNSGLIYLRSIMMI